MILFDPYRPALACVARLYALGLPSGKDWYKSTMEMLETKGRAKMLSLFDAGTFVEMGTYVRRTTKEDAYDAVLCGYGAVNGQLTFAFVQDSDRNHGALDAVGADKIERLYAQALRSGAPVIGVFDSAGAMVLDGVSALSAYGRVMKCVEGASGIIPQIAYVSGNCLGMAATIAAMFDITLTLKDVSDLYVSAPVENNGLSAYTAEDEAQALTTIRTLIDLLPRNNKDSEGVEPTDDLNRPIALATDAQALLATLADNGQTIALYGDYDANVTTVLARLGGVTVGMIYAQNTLTAKGARKAARMVSLCDSFSMPVITLVDAQGVEQTADPELAGALARLASAYINATCPKISVVVGKAYGAAFTWMGSRALGADLSLALPTAVISVMDPTTAVAFLWNDQITQEVSRADVEARWVSENASPEAAAHSGDIDDIIPEAELRARLISAVYMLSECAVNTPDRKHGNQPL